jgi:excisionase family DNA binding protein
MTAAGTHTRLLTLEEAASRCFYSARSVRRAIERGDLEAVRLGPNKRYPLRVSEEALERWLRPAGQEGEQ